MKKWFVRSLWLIALVALASVTSIAQKNKTGSLECQGQLEWQRQQARTSLRDQGADPGGRRRDNGRLGKERRHSGEGLRSQRCSCARSR